LEPLELAHTIVNALEEKKGENIILLDIQKIASFTDFFVICNGTSDRMLDALAKGVMDKVRETHHKKGRKDGDGVAGWEVIDFGSVMVHLFAPEQRNFYKLEELWGEGKILVRLQ
jgi:ribosome-associated protein